MQRHHFRLLLAGVETDGQVQPIVQRLAFGVVVPVRILQILEGGIKDSRTAGHP